jgi:hypothetical protein
MIWKALEELLRSFDQKIWISGGHFSSRPPIPKIRCDNHENLRLRPPAARVLDEIRRDRIRYAVT